MVSAMLADMLAAVLADVLAAVLAHMLAAVLADTLAAMLADTLAAMLADTLADVLAAVLAHTRAQNRPPNRTTAAPLGLTAGIGQASCPDSYQNRRTAQLPAAAAHLRLTFAPVLICSVKMSPRACRLLIQRVDMSGLPT